MDISQLHSLPLEEQAVLLNGPALVPPPGVVPQLQHPPSKNNVAFPVLVITLTIATFVVLVKAYSRKFVTRKVYLEDGFALVGYAFFVAFVYSGFRLVLGTGLIVHQWDVRLKDLAEILYVIQIATIFYKFSIATLKVAILLEWVRIFAPRGTRGSFHRICLILLWANVLCYTSFLIAENSICTPYNAIWDKTIPAKCISRKPIDVSSATVNIISHILILALPHGIIWNLQISTRKKIGISLIFAIGILTTVSGVFRLYWTIRYYLCDDATYTIGSMSLWCLAELTLLIVVYCLPDFPRALSGLSLVGKHLLSSYQSWKASSTGRFSRKEQPSWRLSDDDREPSVNSYQKSVEQGVQARELDVLGTKTSISHDRPRFTNGDFADSVEYSKGIVYTTRFETR